MELLNICIIELKVTELFAFKVKNPELIADGLGFLIHKKKKMQIWIIFFYLTWARGNGKLLAKYTTYTKYTTNTLQIRKLLAKYTTLFHLCEMYCKLWAGCVLFVVKNIRFTNNFLNNNNFIED